MTFMALESSGSLALTGVVLAASIVSRSWCERPSATPSRPGGFTCAARPSAAPQCRLDAQSCRGQHDVGALIPAVAAASLVFLAGLGAVGAKTGGGSPVVGAGRVLFWGAAAMAATAGVGWLFGTVAA